MTDDLIQIKVKKYNEGANAYQERRHEDWRENYSLYRDNPITNRLTQRQSVNMPLMKETIRTLLSKMDEFPEIYFESLSGDKQKEIFINEYWKWNYIEDNLEVKDIADKKQVGLYGRSTMKLNLFENRATMEVLDPHDWVADKFADPSDIDNTAMYMCHQNIFRSLSQLSKNPLYNQESIAKLQEFFATSMGLIKAQENAKQVQAKNERLEDMGLTQEQSNLVGETFVEIKEHYMKLWDEEAKEMKVWVRVTASGEEMVTLAHNKLEDILNINFFPFVSWADDVEKSDLWSDGIADTVRTPNKVVNAWLSQLVENRTLRNYGMNYYDNTVGDGKFVPQTFEPTPWGWYPVHGDPNKVVKRVEIPDLSESIDEMEYLVGMVERATASTKATKGVTEGSKTTLGEIQIAQANANERIVGMAKFYRIARRQLGEKWYKLIEANADNLKPVKLYKKSYKGNMFEKEVKPEDWRDEMGYDIRVVSSSERDANNLEEVQRLQGIRSQFSPENVPMQNLVKRKMLGLMKDASPEEIEEIMNAEREITQAPQVDPTQGTGDPNAPEGAEVPELALVNA